MKAQFKHTLYASVISIIIIGLFLSSCKKEVTVSVTEKINEFIKLSMEDVYLWEKYLPKIDYKKESDSKAYFKKLLYEEDKWSFITDDIAALEGSFAGVETSFGYSLAFGRFSNTGYLFALIEYVYPNSPASIAGLKRGDILFKLNGSDITELNYKNLLYGTTISVTLGINNNGSISAGNTVSITSQVLNLNPVLITNIIEINNRKIGYLFYAQYINSYNPSLDAAFLNFKSSGITDLVLDIRYNPGGYISAAQYLCSSVAPLSVVSTGKTLVTLKWNDYYQNYWQNSNYPEQLQLNFKTNPAVNLNLNKIYILTGSGSASASELTITGLDPYMDVVLIGDTTYGKYTGSITIKPEDLFEDKEHYKDFSNWGLQPIVLRYANANGVTDFKNGFAPDHYVYDNLWLGTPLGDENEPLLAKAVELIGGTIKASPIKKQDIPDYEFISRGFSRFDMQKQNLIVDWIKP